MSWLSKAVKNVTKAVTHAVEAPIKHAEVAANALASGKPQNIFKDEFKQLKADAKTLAKDVTAVGADITHATTAVIRAQSSFDSKVVGGVGKALGNNWLGNKVTSLSNHMKEDGTQLAGAMDDIADGEAKLAEEGKFFNLSAQNTERKRINNNWIKDRVVYDKQGNPHVVKGLGGKAAMALSVASVFVPALAPFAAAANAANAANNGNWRGAALAAVSYFAPGLQQGLAGALGAGESAVGTALANAASRGLIQGAETAIAGGKFEQGFINGAAGSVAGSLTQGVWSEIAPHVDGLPPQLQTTLKNAIGTTINNTLTGQHNGASVQQQLVGGMANWLGSETGQYFGLNQNTSNMLGKVAAQYANGKGKNVDLVGAAVTLFKDPAIAKAFEAMVNGGISSVNDKGTAPVSNETWAATFGAGIPYIPANQITAQPALPQDGGPFDVSADTAPAFVPPETFEA